MENVRHRKVITKLTSEVTIAASASNTSSVYETKDAQKLAISVKATFHASATKGITVYVYTSPDGDNYDTDELFSFEPSFTAGSSIQKTAFFDPDMQEMKVKVTNNDTGQSVTAVSVWITETREYTEP